MSIKIIYSTVPKLDEAKNIAKILIEKKLAACINISSPIISIYEWENQICEDEEFQLFIKTSSKQVDAVINTIKEAHSYDIPAIMVIPVEGGNKDFIKWVQENTNSL